jgi:hypothetical protein
VRIPLEEDFAIWPAPSEYVLVRKLPYHQESSSDRQLRDVSAILEISGGSIEMLVVEWWVERLRLEEALKVARSFNP